MPTAPTTLAAYQADLTPLQGRWGRAWALSVGASKDVTIERARQAALAGAVSRAPDDALVYLGADVALERLPGEPDARYRARIAAAWGTWPWAGTATALVTVFAQVGSVSTRLATAHELGRVPWAQWWAFLTIPTPWTLRAWGAPATWGSGVWGSNASRNNARTARRLARQFSNARDRGWIVFLRTSPGVWGAPSTWGAPGVWGGRNPRWRT